MSKAERDEMVNELWLARRLKVDLGGTTTRGCRRARIRAAIVEQGLVDKWAAPFERLYGVPLTTTETEYLPMEAAR